MRIDLNANVPLADANPSQARRSRSSADAGSPAVQLQAGEPQASVRALAASALAAPETRTSKIEALRVSFEAGTYNLTPEQIATSILDQMRTLT